MLVTLEVSGNGDKWQNGSEAFCVSFMYSSLLLLVMMFSLKIVLMTLKRHK